MDRTQKIAFTVLVIVLGSAAAIALWYGAQPPGRGPVVTAADIEDVIAGAIHLTRQAAGDG